MSRLWIPFAAVVLVAWVLAAGDEPPQVDMQDRGATLRPTSHPGHEGHQQVNHDILMHNDLIAYQLRYCACVDKAHDPKVVPLEGYIGMPLPASCNWYHSGFLRILLDGEDIGQYPLADFAALDSGERGLCRMVWDYPGGRVRVSFVLEADGRCLKTQILLAPNQPPTSISLALNCYPSFFTSHYKRQGARRILTPATEVKEGATANVPAADNWWALYQDEVFDVARGEGEGPCALLLMPAQADEVHFAPGGYAVPTTITFKPDQRDLRLAFWDFKGLTNAEALEYLKAHSGQTLADLLNTSFTPLILEHIDLAAERREFEQLVARGGGSELAQQQRQRLDEAEKAVAAARQGDWQSEKKLADLMKEYHNALWELRIEALFAE